LPIDTFKKVTPMEVVTVSSKFQVVIPLRVRESLGVRPGERMQVVQYGDRIELIPQRPARALRGLLRGIDTDVPRDSDRT
jgi:AbrB family looped-hinge helix DNA binding protein